MSAIDVDKTDIELFQFGDHQIHFHERDNPEDTGKTRNF